MGRAGPAVSSRISTSAAHAAWRMHGGGVCWKGSSRICTGGSGATRLPQCCQRRAGGGVDSVASGAAFGLWELLASTVRPQVAELGVTGSVSLESAKRTLKKTGSPVARFSIR